MSIVAALLLLGLLVSGCGGDTVAPPADHSNGDLSLPSGAPFGIESVRLAAPDSSDIPLSENGFNYSAPDSGLTILVAAYFPQGKASGEALLPDDGYPIMFSIATGDSIKVDSLQTAIALTVLDSPSFVPRSGVVSQVVNEIEDLAAIQQLAQLIAERIRQEPTNVFDSNDQSLVDAIQTARNAARTALRLAHDSDFPGFPPSESGQGSVQKSASSKALETISPWPIGESGAWSGVNFLVADASDISRVRLKVRNYFSRYVSIHEVDGDQLTLANMITGGEPLKIIEPEPPVYSLDFIRHRDGWWAYSEAELPTLDFASKSTRYFAILGPGAKNDEVLSYSNAGSYLWHSYVWSVVRTYVLPLFEASGISLGSLESAIRDDAQALSALSTISLSCGASCDQNFLDGCTCVAGKIGEQMFNVEDANPETNFALRLYRKAKGLTLTGQRTLFEKAMLLVGKVNMAVNRGNAAWEFVGGTVSWGKASEYGIWRVRTSNTEPIAAFTVSPSSGTLTADFQMDASGCTDAQDAASALQVRWDWENDGTWDTSYSTTKTVGHQYSSTGVKTIKLEVKDTGGLSATATRTVTIGNPPSASFTVSPASGSLSTTFQVDASGSADGQGGSQLEVRWDWENNGNWTGFSTAQTAGHQYVSVGTKTIKLEVKNPLGLAVTATRTVDVTDGSMPPTASFTVSPPRGSLATVFQVDASASYDDVDPNSALQVRWNWEGGVWTNYTTSKTASHKYTGGGSKHIELQVKDRGGQTNSVIESIYVEGPLPTMSASCAITCRDCVQNRPGDNAVGANVSVPWSITNPWSYPPENFTGSLNLKLEAYGRVYGGPDHWVVGATQEVNLLGSSGTFTGAMSCEPWDDGDHLYVSTIRVHLLYTPVGGSQIQIYSNTLPITHGANTPPTAAFTVSPPSGPLSTSFQVDASGSTDAQDATSQLQMRWDWENDGTWDTGYSTTKTASHQYASAGPKTIAVMVKDTSGLTGTTTRTVTVNPATTPTMTASCSIACVDCSSRHALDAVSVSYSIPWGIQYPQVDPNTNGTGAILTTLEAYVMVPWEGWVGVMQGTLSTSGSSGTLTGTITTPDGGIVGSSAKMRVKLIYQPLGGSQTTTYSNEVGITH